MAVGTLAPSMLGVSSKLAMVRAEGSMSFRGTLAKSVVVMTGMCTDALARATSRLRSSPYFGSLQRRPASWG